MGFFRFHVFFTLNELQYQKFWCIIQKHDKNAPLAQLAEQLTLNQWVRGSSPRGCTILISRTVIVFETHTLK